MSPTLPWRLLFEANPVPMWVFDEETLRFLLVNDAAIRRYGWSEEAFLDTLTLDDIRPPEELPRLREWIASNRDPLDHAGHWLHRTRSGETFEVDVTQQALEFMGRPARLVLAHDVSAHVSALRDAQAARSRFQAVFEGAPGGLLVLEPDSYRILAASDAYVALSRRSRDELVGQSVFDVFFSGRGTAGSHTEAALRRSLDWVGTHHRADTMPVVPYALPHPGTGESEKRHFLPINSAISGPDGTLLFIIHRVDDVTDRVRDGTFSAWDEPAIPAVEPLIRALEVRELNREVHRLSRRMSQVLEGMLDAFVALDLKGRFTYLNRAAEEVLGEERAGLLGQRLLDRFPEARGSELHRQMREASTTNEPRRFETWAAHFERWFRIQIYPSEEGLSIFFADITESQRAAEALRTSEGRFRSVARATADVVWDWDLESDTVWWNEEMESRLGYDPNDTDGPLNQWIDHVHPDDRDRVLRRLEEALAGTDEYFENEFRFRKSDGSWAVLQDRAYILRDPDTGQALRMIGGITDRTEARSLEQQLYRNQRLESLGTLAGGIAHDLNNILAPILMSTEVLRSQLDQARAQMSGQGPDGLTPGFAPANPPPATPGSANTAAGTEPLDHARELVDTLEGSARRGADLVRQVLTFARGAGGEQAPLDVNDVVREVAVLLRQTMAPGLEVSIRTSDDIPEVMANGTQLHQVLLNLSVNARDAMPDGGRLRIETSQVHLDDSSARPLPGGRAGHWVRLSVSDTGTGMTPDTVDRIFDPFFTTKEVGEGTGLGLSTVQAIVRGHRGFVNVYSEPGRGTSFRIYVPALDADAETAPAAGSRAATRQRRTRPAGEGILVIDDEPALLRIVTQVLERSGYTVFGAADGAQGVEHFRSHQAEIRAVVTDNQMPRMDGESTVAALRAIDPEVRVLLVSGLEPGGALRDEIEGGRLRFLAKPYAPDELLTELEAMLTA